MLNTAFTLSAKAEAFSRSFDRMLFGLTIIVLVHRCCFSGASYLFNEG
jgi:hypothetical protein